MFISEVIHHLEDTLGTEHIYTNTLKSYVRQMEELAPIKHINALALEFIDWRLETIRNNLITGYGYAWAALMDEETIRQILIDSLDTKENFMHLAAQTARQKKGVLLTAIQIHLLQKEVWRQCTTGSRIVKEKIRNTLDAVKTN